AGELPSKGIAADRPRIGHRVGFRPEVVTAEAKLVRPLPHREVVAWARVLHVCGGVRVEGAAANVEPVVHDEPDVAGHVGERIDADIWRTEEARSWFVRVNVVAEDMERFHHPRVDYPGVADGEVVRAVVGPGKIRDEHVVVS